MKIKTSKGERVGHIILIIILIFSGIITLYPFIYVLSMSISDPINVIQQKIWLFPKGFSLGAYKMVFENKMIWKHYYNTIWYTVIGTIINIIMTVIGAYPLSRKKFFLKKPIMLFIVITMFFSGGMIPSFILVNKLGLYNTRWAMVIPGAVSAWNIIIAKSFFQSIPESLQESATIDGANDITVLWKIVLPLSKPILAVLTLFCAVGYWNSYFSAILYLPNPNLQPMQVYLAKILIQLSEETAGSVQSGLRRGMMVEQLKYAAIIVTILPILFIYPFLQKYFVKGVMIGAIKE